MARAFVHIKRYGLVYARVPKVANSSIKTCLTRLVTVTPVDGLKPTNDRFWRECTNDEAELLGGPAYAERFDEFFSFSFVREPRDRLLSCYVNKIIANGATGGFETRGYRADMTFDEFVAHTCSFGVKAMEVHTQPQSFLIRDRHGRWPDFVGLLERVNADWERLGEILAQRGVPPMGALPIKNSRKEAREGVSSELTPATEARMRDVYGKSFELFDLVRSGRFGR